MRVSVLTRTEALVTVDVEPGDVVEVLTAKVNALEPSRGGTCLMLYGKALEPGRTLAECGVEDGGLLQQVPAQLDAPAPAPAPALPAPSAQVLSAGPSAAPEAGGGSGTSASTSSGGSDGGPTATPLVLIGDSTIDNVVWVDHPDQCITSHVARTLGPAFAVVNFAADGYTTGDVLHGGVALISRSARTRAGDPLPDDGASAFAPLVHLTRVPNAASGIVVLSVGGNDIREILRSMSSLQSTLRDLVANYLRIVGRVLAVTKRVVLQLQYRPSIAVEVEDPSYFGVYRAIDAGFPVPGMSRLDKLHLLMEQIYPPILALARDHRLPVIDLPRSFDAFNGSLYKSQIEPSSEGGSAIAALISHVVSHHNFEGPSVLYLQPPTAGTRVLEEPNEEGRPWSVADAWRGQAV